VNQPNLPMFLGTPEDDAQARQQVALRYQWTRAGLARAREAFRAGDLETACSALVHAAVMRDSARHWRRS
jgi:hypothetical protein